MKGGSGAAAVREVDPRDSNDLAPPKRDVRLERLSGQLKVVAQAHSSPPMVNQRSCQFALT
jgi:hypothetical protein